MHNFYQWTRGDFEISLKRGKILTLVFKQKVRMLPCKIHRTRIETVVSALCKCQARDFSPTFQKLIKPIKLMMCVLNVRSFSNSKMKTIGYA